MANSSERYLLRDEPVELNAGRRTIRLTVSNTGDQLGVRKAGNPDTMDGVSPQLILGPGTEVINGAHLIATAGVIDSHIHMICPQQVYDALANGVTTFIGGGTGPADGASTGS